jgi:hypothetical protein
MKTTKKRVKRYDGGGETSADQRAFYGFSDEDKSPGEATTAPVSKKDVSGTDLGPASDTSDQTPSSRYEPKLVLAGRPDLSDQYTVAASPKKTKPAPAKKAAPESTTSSTEEGMRNYIPRKPHPYRQVTQRELAESYVKKRRAAQDEGMKSGGSVRTSASRRADGIAMRGQTRGKYL